MTLSSNLLNKLLIVIHLYLSESVTFDLAPFGIGIILHLIKDVGVYSCGISLQRIVYLCIQIIPSTMNNAL